jgi:hypothetical protein
MRTTFLVSSTCELVSAVRPKAEPHMLKAGMPITLAQPYQTERGLVPAGAPGYVELVDDFDGTTWVLMTGTAHPALYHWDNRLVLSPYTTEDLAQIIQVSCEKPCGERCLPKRLPVDKKTSHTH